MEHRPSPERFLAAVVILDQFGWNESWAETALAYDQLITP